MNNIFSFHGSDHKSGVTMIAQSVTQELCRKYSDRTFLFMGMNSRSSCDFVKEETSGIDDIRMHIENKTLTAEEIKMICHCRDNYYMLGGIRDIVNGRDYFPGTSKYLMRIISNAFDMIICDTGSDLDNGLAFGALEKSDFRYCIIPQCESGIKEYEEKKWLYEKFNLNFDRIIVNKFFPKDPYDIAYMSKRLELEENKFMTVRMAGYARQAEMDRRTLLEYRNDTYGVDIGKLADFMAGTAGFGPAAERRKRLWKTGSI